MSLQDMLDAVTARASGWPVVLDFRETGPDHIGVDMRVRPGTRQAHLACGQCGQSVLCLNTDLDRASSGYQVTPGGITASVAAHMRQCHEN